MRQRVLVLLCLSTPAICACTRSAGLFSDENARAHIEMLAGTIGSRPIGSAANARARAYLIDQLKLYGYEVRVQQADARQAEYGRTARVSNIIAIRQGARPEAIGLVAHYDSVPDAPGAADDGLGVGVALEAARVLAARPERQWTIFVLLTDGEEAGLMGAAALVTDREISSRLHAYVNIEAIGSSGTAILFETGPGNAWLVGPWARRATHPRGGSYTLEVYRRLPNDTDFSVFRQQEIPGLNFATTGDSYAYHTARDTPDRLSLGAVRNTGENIVAVMQALDAVDITARDARGATYFDIGGTVAVTYGSTVSWIVVWGALVFGAIAWVKVMAAALRLGGVLRWLLTAVWSVVGAAAAVGAMVGATWALRAASQVYHPWYARPDRLLLLLFAIAVTASWSVSRAGAWLPSRFHGVRHPVMTWSLTLPLWLAMTLGLMSLAPAASYLWALPLLTAGIALVVTRATSSGGIRIASLLVLAVAATLWLRETLELARFMVAMFGRLPIITPVYVYAGLLTVAGLMVVPPFVATVAASRPLLRPTLVTTLCLLAVGVAGALAFAAPAYTFREPLRRTVRALQEPGSSTAVWEVASVEPGLDLAPEAPRGWTLSSEPAPASIPWGRLPHPFVFRTSGPPLGAAPADIAGFSLRPAGDGIELTLGVVPKRESLTISFVLPSGIIPARSSLRGVRRLGRWTATYVAPPPDGVVWQATFATADEARLRETRVAITDSGFPEGTGWQRLPAWLPQEHAVWAASATWVVPATAAPPVPAPPPVTQPPVLR